MTGGLIFILWTLVDTEKVFPLWVLSISWMFGVGSVIQWAADWIFAGTPVSNAAAQTAYGILVIVWGFLVGYVVIPEVPSKQEEKSPA